MTLFIIQCSGKKRTYSCPAKEMYQGNNFKKIFSLLSNSKILIFSAKYGLLNPEDIIEPYSCTLEKSPPGYTANYSKEEILNYKIQALKAQEEIIPILIPQIKTLDEIPYLVLSKAYQECYEKAGGKFISNLQQGCGGTYFIYETVKSRLEELKLISNNNPFDF